MNDVPEWLVPLELLAPLAAEAGLHLDLATNLQVTPLGGAAGWRRWVKPLGDAVG